MDNGEKLRKLVKEYKEQHPEEQDPLRDAGFVSITTLIKIFEEANGRKVRFVWDERKKHAMGPSKIVYED